MKDTDRQTPQHQPNGAKQYSAPVLIEYGSVAKLTMTKGGSFRELTNKKTTNCL
jgi:hypothetical protein